MRIKVLDIVLPFFTMFQLIHKRNRKNSSSTSSWLMVSSGWQTANRLLCIHIHCVMCMRCDNTQVSKISIQFFPFTLSVIDETKQIEHKNRWKKWKPKVLLAFQSSLEQEITFANKNEWNRADERQRESDRERRKREWNPMPIGL